MWGWGSRSRLWLPSSCSTSHLFQHNPRSQLSFGLLYHTMDCTVQLKWLKPSFPPNLKPFCILILYFNVNFFLSQIRIIYKLNSTGQTQSPVRCQWEYSSKVTQIGLLWVWLQVHHSELSHCLHFFIFPRRISYEAVKIPVERETQYFNSILLF